MTEVSPIKDKAKIGAIKDYLKEKSLRDYLFFVAGCNLAIRVSDLLALRVQDVRDSQGNIRRFVRLIEKKNKNNRVLAVNKTLEEALILFFNNSPVLEKEAYLFTGEGRDRPMTRQNAHLIISGACKAVGLEGAYACHSLRKTWGYFAYQKKVRLEEIMHKLGHKSPGMTLRYIGIEQEDTHRLEIEICI